jgi:vancomycin resistance protein VanJ
MPRLRVLLRYLWLGLAWTSLVIGCVLMLGLRFVGHYWHWLAFLLHVPLLLGPALALLLGLIGWGYSRRLALALILMAAAQAGPLLGWRSHGARVASLPAGQPRQLRVATCNRGQHHGHRLMDFLRHTQADLLMVQDAHAPGALVPHSPDYAAYPHLSRIGELALLSRYPIMKTELVSLQLPRPLHRHGPWYKLLRCEVLTPMGRVVLFSLHLPSPRHAVQVYRSPAIWTPAGQLMVQRHWEDQCLLTTCAVERIESDILSSRLPTVVLGDWNLPALGPLYRRVTQRLQDTHTHAGQGYGFTCPGDMPVLPAGYQPWLRIDYILASQHWQVLAHETESESSAQHRAVAAVLRLK